MKRNTIIVLTILLVGVWTTGFAVQTRGQNFNSDPGWAGSANRTSPNDFGYSANTRNAGGVL